MLPIRVIRFAMLSACVSALAGTAAAQSATTPPPPPPWAGSVSAGVTPTSGNTDSRQYNVGFDVQAHPGPSDAAKFEGLFLRGTRDGELVVGRTSLGAREEHRLSDKAFVFGQVGFLRDTFKKIDYLAAPVVGIGYVVHKTDTTSLSVDAGAGGVWEKNPNRPVSTSGALTAGESFSHKLSAATTVSQSARALWKTSNLADALYTFNLSLATAFVGNSQLKIDVLDTYKNVVPDPATKKNDLAVVLAVAYKF